MLNTNTSKQVKISIYSFDTNDTLGAGYISKVYKGRNDTTGEIVAMKLCDHNKLQHPIEYQLIQQEIKALSILDSINIIKMYYSCNDTNFTYIITEYCNKGDLADMINQRGNVPENEAIIILFQILTGLKEQFEKGVIHRDLKPSNILINNGIYKIADYGFSKMIYAPKEQIYYNVGTTLYMSPQALTENKYSFKSDIWSLGVMFYQIVCGVLPWQAQTEKEFVKVLTTTPVQFPKNIHLSSTIKDLILKCLTIDEYKRIDIKQLLDHELFIKYQYNPHHRLSQIPQKRNIQMNYSQHRSTSTQNHISKSPLKQRQEKQINYNEAIFNVLQLIKLILRMAKLIDHFDFFLNSCLKQKLLYFIIKHGIFKSKWVLLKLSMPLIGNKIIQKEEFQKEAIKMNEIFQHSFHKLWDSIHRDLHILSELLQDKKFAAVFDQSDLEVSSHYILMLPILKDSILDLQTLLHFKLKNIQENQQLQPFEQGAVLLLTYLYIYQNLSKEIIDKFNDFDQQAQNMKLTSIIEQKPHRLTKYSFTMLCQKIQTEFQHNIF